MNTAQLQKSEVLLLTTLPVISDYTNEQTRYACGNNPIQRDGKALLDVYGTITKEWGTLLHL